MITDRGMEIRAVTAELLNARGESVFPASEPGFDISPIALPAPPPKPGAPVTFSPGYVLVLSCRSPLVSPPRLGVLAVIPASCPPRAVLAAAIDGCLGRLRQQHQQILASPAPGQDGQQSHG